VAQVADSPAHSIDNLRCELQLITSPAEFAEAKTPWIEFLHRSSVLAGLFTDPRVMEHSICFDRGDIVVLGKVLKGDRLIAIVPLISQKTHATFTFGLVTLCRLALRSARLADFEFPTEEGFKSSEVFAAVADACAERRFPADLIFVESASACTDGKHTLASHMSNVQTTYTINILGSFDAYLQALAPRSRQKLKRTIRRFEEATRASMQIACLRRPAEMQTLHSELTHVRERSWHARVGSQHVPSIDYLASLAAHGWVRAYVLSVREQPVATVLGFQYRNTFYYEAPAYDQDWQEHSPGIVLLYYTLKDLFETDSPVRLDFGFGYGQYKQVFGTHEEDRGTIRIGTTRRGRLIAWSQRFLDVVFRVSKAALAWTGIPRVIKKRIRQGK
jgi:CelD/BcsL family acetyltransferase involved in cellulose biosynthesis